MPVANQRPRPSQSPVAVCLSSLGPMLARSLFLSLYAKSARLQAACCVDMVRNRLVGGGLTLFPLEKSLFHPAYARFSACVRANVCLIALSAHFLPSRQLSDPLCSLSNNALPPPLSVPSLLCPLPSPHPHPTSSTRTLLTHSLIRWTQAHTPPPFTTSNASILDLAIHIRIAVPL